MTGLCHSFMGLSFLNASTIARRMRAASLGAAARLRGVAASGDASTCMSSPSVIVHTSLEERSGMHQEMLEHGPERVCGEERERSHDEHHAHHQACLLYTSDAADE